MKRLDKIGASKEIMFYIAFAVCLIAFFYYIGTISGWVNKLFDVLRPVLYGIAFSFLLNVLMRPIEERIFAPLGRKSKRFAPLQRPLSIIVTFLVLLGILAMVFLLVLPRFIESLVSLASQIPDYVDNFMVFLDKTLAFYNLSDLRWADFGSYASEVFQKIAQGLQNAVPHILGFTVNFTSGLINMIFGFVFAFYMLAQKENLLKKTKALMSAYLPNRYNDKICYFGQITNDTFRNFLGGQCLDSLCLGTITFIVLTIIQMPYALVIAVTVAVTNMIPILGPILGTIPCAFIILVISPIKAVILVIIIILLQEFESKIIYPRIVGGRVGLDGLWVLMAVLVGGNIGGLLGIILGVPICAVGGKIIGENIKKRLGEIPWDQKTSKKGKKSSDNVA